ncbi:hypothetical protein L195_g021644 [Trifolium pratense]|uniref:Uncharacterized protein n=2 Tax=Trifolium pratense TaxID=57577 RepID=A0A2K3N5S8_TRIPR|nr:hypothetical protein L195_g021644 [Trifolium pratense]CAJ2665444.1 unnamed protein product [Trifolium pratense]
MINQEVNILSSSKLSDELSAPIIKDVIAAGETNTILETSENSNEDIVAVSETSSVDDPDRNYTSTPRMLVWL